MSDDNQRMTCATRFEILPEFYPAYGRRVGGISVEKREQRDGDIKWVVLGSHGIVLTKAGNWVWEHIPSSRTEAHIARTRFDSLDDAWQAAVRVSRRTLRNIVKEFGLAPYQKHNGALIPFPQVPA